jgi:hypothetical protein
MEFFFFLPRSALNEHMKKGQLVFAIFIRGLHLNLAREFNFRLCRSNT